MLMFKQRCFVWILAEALAEAANFDKVDALQSSPDEGALMVIDDEDPEDLSMNFDDGSESSFDNHTTPEATNYSSAST